MALQASIISLIFVLFIFFASVTAVQHNLKIFDVRTYGAAGDGQKDNTQAFLLAWKDACGFAGKATVYVPVGIYMLGQMAFVGPCKGRPIVHLQGVLRAPSWFGPSDSWITFRYINKLVVKGGKTGTLDGQGQFAWKNNDCHSNSNCSPLPATLRFEFVTNSRVHDIRSINSKNSHIVIFGCKNVNMTNIRLTAPQDSPNTDGIKIGSSTNIKIVKSVIGTGDDCVAILAGSRDILISKLFCGPGHGISVGSLGGFPNEKNVAGLIVKNCTISNANNGVRIKTWESPHHSIASGFTFEDIFMNNVQNPIIIDQLYCPHPPCNDQYPSHVQIKDVLYKNIWGTSITEVAVSLKCSSAFPCKNIVMKDINLAHQGSGAAKSLCSHVDVLSFGKQSPPPCL
ncbi:hypothetical protein SLEP1_g16358 [Rubroshorea leprosula]|uniref:Polygalacturonase n=1 Tax=Rubroshorea leprosula TaxID=152421 RepID=A0AAV5IQM3_9ROSI|nr:hypothetical protein SLEP1_g16358 [Rubroshorea leprosula]